MKQAWAARVLVNGRDSGIIETNRYFAEQYWRDRARVTRRRYKLEVIKGGKAA